MITKCNEIGILTGGKWDKMYDQSRRVYGADGLCPTLHTCGGGNQEIKVITMNPNESKPRIRKLTPLECWRLMGFTDEDFHKAEKVCSNTQLIKQAGNSIVVPVLEGILRNLIPPEEFAPQKQTPMEWLNEFFGGD